MLKLKSFQAFNERFGDSGLFGYPVKCSASIAMHPQRPMSRQRLSGCSLNSDTAIHFASIQSESASVSDGRSTVSCGRSTTSNDMSPESTLTISTLINLDDETSDSPSSFEAIGFLSDTSPNVPRNMDDKFPLAYSTSSLDSPSAFLSDECGSWGPQSSPDNSLAYAESCDVDVCDLLAEIGDELDTEQENLRDEPHESYALMIPSIGLRSQAHERYPPGNGSKSLIDEHASSSDSLVFNHLKVLLSELDIPDNDSPKYHVAWAFDPPFSKPKPSAAFDDIAFELEQIRNMRTVLGEDLKARINKLRSGRPWSSVIRPTVPNRKLSSRPSYTSTPSWSIIRPVKASTLVNAITVCRRMSGTKTM